MRSEARKGSPRPEAAANPGGASSATLNYTRVRARALQLRFHKRVCTPHACHAPTSPRVFIPSAFRPVPTKTSRPLHAGSVFSCHQLITHICGYIHVIHTILTSRAHSSPARFHHAFTFRDRSAILSLYHPREPNDGTLPTPALALRARSHPCLPHAPHYPRPCPISFPRSVRAYRA